MLTADEVIVAAPGQSSRTALELVSDVSVVIPQAAPVVSVVSDESDPDFINRGALDAVDRLCELDVAAAVYGWSRHVTWPARVVSSSVDGSAALSRYAHVAARVIGSLEEYGVVATPADVEDWSAAVCEPGEWQLLSGSLSEAVCGLGLRDVFEEGERVEIALVSSTLRALTCGALGRRAELRAVSLSAACDELMSGRI